MSFREYITEGKSFKQSMNDFQSLINNSRNLKGDTASTILGDIVTGIIFKGDAFEYEASDADKKIVQPILDKVVDVASKELIKQMKYLQKK